jgi:hypothetical protein
MRRDKIIEKKNDLIDHVLDKLDKRKREKE